jgi:hypothetical protein
MWELRRLTTYWLPRSVTGMDLPFTFFTLIYFRNLTIMRNKYLDDTVLNRSLLPQYIHSCSALTQWTSHKPSGEYNTELTLPP